MINRQVVYSEANTHFEIKNKIKHDDKMKNRLEDLTNEYINNKKTKVFFYFFYERRKKLNY